jgi:hypothetical protein
MSVFTLAIATTKTAYDTYKTAAAATAAARQAIVDAGARPTYPVDVLADADWNSVTTAQNTWDATNTTLTATLAAAEAAQRTAELAVMTTMGYGSASTVTSGIVANQWVRVVGAGGGVLTYTNYIGWGSTSSYLQILTTAPTQAYPLF